MGKKGKDKKKGKGAEKTALKTEKKLTNKQKKELQALGEDDIETIVAEIEKEEQKRLQVQELVVETPTRRINFSFIPHPEKEELILYGGEFFNGQKTFIYGDLLFYSIPNSTWTVVKAPGGPPPRCGHQMIATSTNKGQLWVFGGEYASPTQSQFYHYRDLWVYHLQKKQWEKILSPNGPSARSGHRMVYSKKKIFVFGGFHDNLRDYKYFNDIYMFDTESYKWTKLEPTGIPPLPRSGCCIAALPDGRILIYGGYSKEKIKKDVDKGHVYSDSFMLTLDKNDTTGLKFKWVTTKIGGIKFDPRCSMPITTAPNNSAYCFGGVFDVIEDEENLSGVFYNDLITLDLETLHWRNVNLTGKKEIKKKLKDAEEKMEVEENEDTDDIQKTVEPETLADDGVFKVTIAPAATSSSLPKSADSSSESKQICPTSRMNCGLAVKHGILYLYGGMVEMNEKEITYNDFYSLDLKKLDEWKVLQNDDIKNVEWVDSDKSDDEDGSDDGSEEDSDDSMESD